MSAPYEAFSNANPSPLTDLPIQYADFATWQRQWLQGERLNKQLAFWKEHLREMDELKQSVQNAAYEQKDPCDPKE
jgi:hypothetical protein